MDCPIAAVAADSMEKLKGDSVVFLNYHFNDPFNNSDATGRKEYYGVLDLPTVKIMGKRSCVDVSATVSCFLFNYGRAMNDLSPCTIGMDVDYDSTTRGLKVKTSVTALDTISDAEAHLRYAIAESHIYYQWHGLDSVQHVVRKMLPDHVGIPFSIQPGETFVDSQSYTLESEWNDHNCYVVTFVQADAYNGNPVLRSAREYLIVTYQYGDANGDGSVDLADVVFLINYLYKGGAAPDPSESGDANGDCIIDLADIVYLLNYLYKGGAPPEEGCA